MSFMDKMRTKFIKPVGDVAVVEPSDDSPEDYSNPKPVDEVVVELLTTFARKAVAGVANVAESKPSDTTTEEYPNLNPVDETVVDLLAPFARTPVASVADAAILEPLNQLKGEPVCVPVSALLPKSIGIQRQSLRYTLQEGGGTILGGAGDTVDDLLQTLIEQWPDELILVMQDNLELYHRP